MTADIARIGTFQLVGAAVRRLIDASLCICRSLFESGHLRRRARENDGFTLVEVIAAIAILSIGLSVTLASIIGSLRQVAQAKRLAEAGSLAQSLFAQIGTDVRIKEGESDGKFSNGYLWQLKMLRYGDSSERERWPVGAYVVSAEIIWDEGGQKRAYSLTTLRLGPKEVSR